MNINIDDYISEDEKSDICREAFRKAAMKRSNEDFERIMSNTGYNIVFSVIDEMIDEPAKKVIKESVLKVIGKINTYQIFRQKDAWDKEESVAYKHLQKTVEENKHLIEKEVIRQIKDINQDYITEGINDVMIDVVTNLIKQRD